MGMREAIRMIDNPLGAELCSLLLVRYNGENIMETRLAPFIAIEGMDGSGKTTLIERLRKTLLTVPGPAYRFTREPGGTSAGESIRGILLDDSLSADADGKTQLLGFFYARAHHLRMIRSFRKNGIAVITDRFDGSTFAYQV